MKISDLEPGSHYTSANGNIRELVSIDRCMCEYRPIHFATLCGTKTDRRDTSKTYPTRTRIFADWALCELEVAA